MKLSVGQFFSALLLEMRESMVAEKSRTKRMRPASMTEYTSQRLRRQSAKRTPLACSEQIKNMIFSPTQYSGMQKTIIRWQSTLIMWFSPIGSRHTRSSMYFDTAQRIRQERTSTARMSWKLDRKKAVRQRADSRSEQKEASGKAIGSNQLLASAWAISQSSSRKRWYKKLRRLTTRPTLRYSVSGLEMFPTEMMSMERQSSSKGVSAGVAVSALENWQQRQMESGLMERLRKTKKVSLRTRLRILFVLISCFSTEKVVNSSRLTTRKLPTSTTRFFTIETYSDCTGKVLISYCKSTPKTRMAKLMQQHAKRCVFLIQYPDSRFSQSMSSASGPGNTVMCCPWIAVEEQQVQNLKKSLPRSPFWCFFRKRWRVASSRKVTKTKSSLFSLALMRFLIILISSFLRVISLVRLPIRALPRLRFLAIRQAFLRRQTACRLSMYFLTRQVRSTFSIQKSSKCYLMSLAEAFRGTLVSMTLRSLSFLLRLVTSYLLFLRKPRTKRISVEKRRKKRKRTQRRLSMKPISIAQTVPTASGGVKWKETGMTEGENMRCTPRATAKRTRTSETTFTQLKNSGISGLIRRKAVVPVQMGTR